MNSNADTEWTGPGGKRARARFRWSALLWSLVYPQRMQRVMPTLPGLVLIGLAFGVGTAAYNASSNILFITLSLLLSCLILSGVLSWFNLRRVTWRLELAPPLRAGHDAVVALGLRNTKKFLPTYGLSFEFAARALPPDAAQGPESTVMARGAEVRAMLAQAEKNERRERIGLRGRLDPGDETRVEWVFRPEQRGVMRVRLASIVSLFPFGFLRKEVGTELVAEAVVWPAPIEYRRHALATARRSAGGERVSRPGTGGDLLALRRYATGDSHRLIHWKASARTRKLLVRQFAAESAEGYSMWLRTDAAVWSRPEQFEVLVSFAATLAEDLFRMGRLVGVALNAEPPLPIRRVHDLELFLDKLAVVRPLAGATGAVPELGVARRNVLTFAPEGARGVGAYVDGNLAASA